MKKDIWWWMRKSNFIIQPVVIIYCLLFLIYKSNIVAYCLIVFGIVVLFAEIYNTIYERKPVLR